MGCSMGALSKLIVEPGTSPYTFDSSSDRLDFLYEDIQKKGRLIGGRAITGTRSAYANRMRQGHYLVSGRLATYTCAADLDAWLPRICGDSETGTGTFELGESISGTNEVFGVLLDRVGGIFQYDNCKVDSCFWRGQAAPGDAEPELIEQVLNIVSTEETLGTSWPSPEPSLSVADNRLPYIMADGTLNIGGTPYNFKSFVLLFDNRLQVRWVNSLAPNIICAGDRVIMLRVTFPFTAASDAVFSGLYQNANRHDGVNASLTFAVSGKNISTTFTFKGLQWVQQSPVVQGKREIDLTLDFVARKTAVATDELVVTNDSTV